MTRKPAPIDLGPFTARACGDQRKLGMGIAAELDEGETVASVTVTVADEDGTAVAGAISGTPTMVNNRATFKFVAPATPGTYYITATFTLADGQVVHKTASIPIF